MPFQYAAGVTTAGAPDEIVDWFATFQQWMTAAVGWTVISGGGTTNIVFRSLGEAGGLTMLFLRVFRDGGNPNRVMIEVRDDAVGTHETAEAGVLDGAGAQFAYWMAGDLDAINICFRGGVLYNSVYAGLVIPFAQTVVDETYQMIATSHQTAGSILRDSTGVWDVDYAMYSNQVIAAAMVDRYDGSLPLGGTYFDDDLNIAGQLKHISGRITDAAINVLDLLVTGRPGATTTWIVLSDRLNRLYACRTGGVLPTGLPDPPGGFAAAAGVAATYPALYAAISAHMVGRGWADLGDPLFLTDGRLYSSTGSSGVDEIFAGFSRQIAAPDRLHGYVQDDALATHRFPVATPIYLDAAEFPINYWICGDQDCVVLVIQRGVGYAFIWSGLLQPFAPGLLPPYLVACLSPYQLYSSKQGHGIGLNITGGLLRGHDGVWRQTIFYASEGGSAEPSNPSNFDGVTYFVWPFLAYEDNAGRFEITGQMRYCGYSEGGGIANMDTITVGAEVYTVFFDNVGENFCVRTV